LADDHAFRSRRDVLKPRRFRTLLTVVSVTTLWIVAVLHHTASAAPPEPGKVVIKDFMFQPMAVTIAAGSTVTWTNQDDEPHTAVSDTGVFRSGAMETGDAFAFKFDKPGTYHFTCSIHPRMVGTIVVTPNP
jgi:plastocyanin